MEAKTMLEKLARAIEQALKGHGTGGRAATRKLTADGLVEHALAEIRKAAQEPVEVAKRRLAALGRAVDTAKQAFVDHASEEIEVEVFQEETTAREDDSEEETSPVALEAALGNSGFAANPEDLTKALATLQKELEVLKAAKEPKPAATGDKLRKNDEAPWPFDMNTREFREGMKKAADAPEWGEDPKELRAKEV